MARVLRNQRISKYKLLQTSWKYQTKEYFNNSTLHGVRFIAEKDRPTYEKIIWFMLVCTGAITTIVIIVMLWQKFLTNPTITGLDTDFHNWDVPFPGVTVCPQKIISPQRINDYIKERWNEKDLSDSKKKYYTDFINLLTNLTYSNLDEIKKFNNDKNLPQNNFREVIFSVVKRCEELLRSCEWKGKKFNCCDSFLPTFTEHGFCYSFNTLHAETEWPWKPNTVAVNMKMHYIYETDIRWSITFDGDSKMNPYDVYIHSSEELPSVETLPQHVWTKTISKIFFASKTTYTTEESKQLSAKQRKCVFPEEIKLATATEYSYWACMTDCRMSFAKKMCSCVPFFYQKLDGFPYCDINGLACLSKYTDEIKYSLNCPCELGCMNTVYEVEKLVEVSDRKSKPPIEIGFVSWPMVRYKREVLFGWVDLLVAFGGIAGLFLGFSLLSAFEILYYFTMRATCMIYKENDKLNELALEDERKKIKEDNDDAFMVKPLSLQRSFKSDAFQLNYSSKRHHHSKQDLFILPFLD